MATKRVAKHYNERTDRSKRPREQSDPDFRPNKKKKKAKKAAKKTDESPSPPKHPKQAPQAKNLGRFYLTVPINDNMNAATRIGATDYAETILRDPHLVQDFKRYHATYILKAKHAELNPSFEKDIAECIGMPSQAYCTLTWAHKHGGPTLVNAEEFHRHAFWSASYRIIDVFYIDLEKMSLAQELFSRCPVNTFDQLFEAAAAHEEVEVLSGEAVFRLVTVGDTTTGGSILDLRESYVVRYKGNEPMYVGWDGTKLSIPGFNVLSQGEINTGARLPSTHSHCLCAHVFMPLKDHPWTIANPQTTSQYADFCCGVTVLINGDIVNGSCGGGSCWNVTPAALTLIASGSDQAVRDMLKDTRKYRGQVWDDVLPGSPEFAAYLDSLRPLPAEVAQPTAAQAAPQAALSSVAAPPVSQAPQAVAANLAPQTAEAAPPAAAPPAAPPAAAPTGPPVPAPAPAVVAVAYNEANQTGRARGVSVLYYSSTH